MISINTKRLHLRNLAQNDADVIGDNFKLKPTEYACQKFKTEYVFHDSRLEGVDIELETAAAIVTDLRLYKQESEYCKEENQNIIEVAGLTFAYDYVFRESETALSIYDAKHLNEMLFCTAPCPEYGGRYRESNTLVLGAKFETVDYQKIPEEMYFLDKDIKKLMDECDGLSLSEYIERVIQIHHRMTVIHAFRDGNGRTTRAFANMMLVLVYKCRQKKLNSLYYKKKEQRRCSTWRKIKNRILRNSSNRSSISTMPEVPHILNWNMNMA